MQIERENQSKFRCTIDSGHKLNQQHVRRKNKRMVCVCFFAQCTSADDFISKLTLMFVAQQKEIYKIITFRLL